MLALILISIGARTELPSMKPRPVVTGLAGSEPSSMVPSSTVLRKNSGSLGIGKAVSSGENTGEVPFLIWGLVIW